MKMSNKIIFATALIIVIIYVSITILGYICLGVVSYYGIKHFINKVLSLKN